MRSFPRTLRRATPHAGRRSGIRVILGSLAASAVVVPGVHVGLAAADDHLRDRRHHVRQQIAAATEALDETSARAQRTSAALATARSQLTGARTALSVARSKVQVARVKDQQAQAALDRAVVELRAARAELAQGRIDVADQRARVADLVTSIYQDGDPQLMSLAALFNAESAADLTNRDQAREVMVDNQSQAYDELRAAEVLLQVREERVQAAKVETAQQRKAAAEQLQATRDAEAEAAAAAAAVEAKVADSRRAKVAAEDARAVDLRKLKQLKKEQGRIEHLLQVRAQQATAGHHGPPQASDGFLSYPANGPVTSPFGYRIHPIYGYYSLHDGTDFGAPCGAPLYAAADGTVVSSYWNTAWGNRLIIDNGYARGVGLATIYNHASHYTVGVGDRVKRGQVIGYVGTTGWSTGCHLHFTVMVNGKAVDPMGWL